MGTKTISTTKNAPRQNKAKSVVPDLASNEIKKIAESLIRNGHASEGIGATPDGIYKMSLIRARLIYKALLKLQASTSQDILGV